MQTRLIRFDVQHVHTSKIHANPRITFENQGIYQIFQNIVHQTRHSRPSVAFGCLPAQKVCTRVNCFVLQGKYVDYCLFAEVVCLVKQLKQKVHFLSYHCEFGNLLL